jgi:hypothetical protein
LAKCASSAEVKIHIVSSTGRELFLGVLTRKQCLAKTIFTAMQSFVFMHTVFRNVTRQTCKSVVRKESVRTFVTSTLRLESFKVQDNKDFQERVKNSKVPVIVDFFATYVLYHLLSNININ